MRLHPRLLGALLAAALSAALMTGCATSGMPAGPASSDHAAAASSVPAEPTSLVLLQVRQTLRGVPAAKRVGLWPWIANVDRAEPLHRVDGDALPEALATQGWIAWRLPEGTYETVIAGYATAGVPPRILLDRYRFVVRAGDRSLYLGSIAYACEPAWWFEALCPDPPAVSSEIESAERAAKELGVGAASQVRLGTLWPIRQRSPTQSGRIPRLGASDTLLVVGDMRAARSVYDFLAEAQAERAIPAEVGTRMLIQLAPYGPLAIVALPAAAAAAVGVEIHAARLADKMQCLQHVWDERIDRLAREFLHEALRTSERRAAVDVSPTLARQSLSAADARARYRHVLALDVQRLVIESCHPSAPWLPDPRGKRFCMEAAVRARVYATDAAVPVSDEVFAVIPGRRVGREFEPTGWPIPDPYLYETPLATNAGVARTVEEYCGPDGSSLVQADLRRMLDAIVPQVLAAHGILAD